MVDIIGSWESALSAFAPPDQARFLFCLVISYPLAFLHRFVPTTGLRHFTSAAIGVWFVYLCVGWEMYHIFVSSTGVYLLLCILPLPVNIAYRVAFAFAMGYLAVMHALRMYRDYYGYTLDVTGSLMVLTIKLTSFCFNVHDGTLPQDKLTPHQRATAVRHAVTPLEFYGYVFWFGGLLAGPSCEFQQYQGFITRSVFKDEKTGKVEQPDSTLASFYRFAIGLLCGIGLVLSGKYPVSFCNEDAFMDLSYPARWFYLNFSVGLVRFRYYFAWLIAEGACVMAGLGYNGRDATGKAKWDLLKQVDVIGVETAQSFKDVSDGWNMNTSHWLKYYVYMRLPDGSALFKLLGTHGTTAFWHGFHPGYYMFFLSISFAIYLGRQLRRLLRPFVMLDEKRGNYPLKYAYDVGSWFMSVSTVNYLAAAFVSLGFWRALEIWQRTLFTNHIAVFALIFACQLAGPALRRLHPKHPTEAKLK